MKPPTEDIVTNLLMPLIDQEQLKLVGFNFVVASRRPLIRLFVDLEDEYITIDRCMDFSRKLRGILEMNDYERDQYRLEVSSPGIDWPLESLWQFKKNAGKHVLKNMEDTQIKGIIVNVTDSGEVILDQGGITKSYSIEYLKNAKVFLPPQRVGKSKRKKL